MFVADGLATISAQLCVVLCFHTNTKQKIIQNLSIFHSHSLCIVFSRRRKNQNQQLLRQHPKKIDAFPKNKSEARNQNEKNKMAAVSIELKEILFACCYVKRIFVPTDKEKNQYVGHCKHIRLRFMMIS